MQIRPTLRLISKQFSGFSFTRTFSAKASNVGIIAMDAYFPSTYVSQTALETHDGIAAGKYTKGLGQDNMAFVNDREDINSMCLTATDQLLKKYDIDPKQIGRLEVGTETIIDKSKSVKTTLMNIFQKSGNTDIEGIDTTNACYGGTAALFNAGHWVESSAWDGRYALVLAGDVAVYEKGVARPTGGAGVVAMLVGPDAPLVFDQGVRSSYMEDAYDFYKPNLESEYPVVDGHHSIICYLRAVHACYEGYKKKYEKKTGKKFSLDTFDYSIFHSPFTKMVQKSYAFLKYLDFLHNKEAFPAEVQKQFADIVPPGAYTDRDILNVFSKVAAAEFDTKVVPSTLLAKQLGNTYCGSLYGGLLSLVDAKADQLLDKKIGMFSYGSGLAASLFSITVRQSVDKIKKTADLQNRLNNRKSVAAADYEAVLARNESLYNTGDYTPQSSVDDLSPGTYYLEKIDNLKRRTYAKRD